MSNSRIHIDKLFGEGLENLELPVFSNDFENIKNGILSNPAPTTPQKPFEDFEFAVTDGDWQIIKDRLAREKSKTIIPLPLDYVGESFKDFEIAVTDVDWQATKSKLNNSGGKKIVWWWWLNIAIIATMIGLAVNYFNPSKQLSGADPKSTLTGSIINEKTTPVIDKNNPVNSNKTANTQQNKNIPLKKVENRVAANPTVEENILKIPANKFNQAGSVNALNEIKVNNISAHSTNSADISNSEITGNKENNGYELKNNPKVTEDENPEKTSVKKSEMNETMPVDPMPAEDHEIKGQKQDAINNPNTNGEGQGTKVNAGINPTDTTNKSKQSSSSASATPVALLSKLPINFYIGLTTDIARTYRHLSKDNSPTYNDIRNKADKPLTQISYGFTAGIQKGKNQLQSGFQLTEQTFVSNYNYVIKIRDSLPVYGQGVLIGKFPIGPLRDTTITGNQKTSIKKVDIPFTYNRFWKLNSKTQLITGFGGVISINTKTEGSKMLSPANNQLYNYNYLKGAERKMGFSPNINIGIQREVRKNIVLQVNGFGKYSVTNRYKNDFQAKQYYYSKESSSFKAKEYIYSYGLSIKLLYLIN